MTRPIPDWRGAFLHPDDRREVLGVAARNAAVMTAIAAAGWYLARIIAATGEPWWHGVIFAAVAFVLAFVWKWRTLLQRIHAMSANDNRT